MREDFEEWLGFVAGGTPSRFMMHEADWERLYRFIDYVAGHAPEERPADAEVRAFLDAALPKRLEWAVEIATAYRHGLALLDYRELQSR